MKKLFTILFIFSLFLLVGCSNNKNEPKNPKEEKVIELGKYYDKNNMYKGSSLEIITFKEKGVERITCVQDGGCSLYKGTYSIEKEIISVALTHYKDEIEGWVDMGREEKLTFTITKKNTFIRDESEFVLEKEKESKVDDTNAEYSVELKKENEKFDFDSLHLEFKGTPKEEDQYNYTVSIKYDNTEVDSSFFTTEKIASTNMAASFKIYKRGNVYILVSNIAKQCYSNEILVFNTNGVIQNTFSNADITINGNNVTVEESPDGNCMDTSNAKTFNYEISGFDLNLK